MYVKDLLLTGSYFMCDPPVITTDIDFMVLTTNINAARILLCRAGWVSSNSSEDYPEENMHPMRRGRFNALIVDSQEYFDKWRLATEVSRDLNLLNKEDRVKVFRRIVGD